MQTPDVTEKAIMERGWLNPAEWMTPALILLAAGLVWLAAYFLHLRWGRIVLTLLVFFVIERVIWAVHRLWWHYRHRRQNASAPEEE